jgi:uncharacterized phage-associated protein
MDGVSSTAYTPTPGPQDARAVANYFLELAKKEGRNIDPMGIQKLVYFAHGWNLAINNRPLIAQRIEAWDYGPVIRDLYQAFRKFGDGPITEPAMIVAAGPGTSQIRFEVPRIAPVAENVDTISLLNRVWEVYKPFTSIQLSNMTHEPGSPWKQARDARKNVIDDARITEFFKSQVPSP